MAVGSPLKIVYYWLYVYVSWCIGVALGFWHFHDYVHGCAGLGRLMIESILLSGSYSKI